MAEYGKLAGGGVGMIVATAIVETADQYLPHALPNSVALAIAALFGLIGIFATPHASLTLGKPTTPDPNT